MTAPAGKVEWSRTYIPAKFYVAGCYYCTRTGNLAAAVAHNGKTLSPHYSKRDKPALVIFRDNTCKIVRLVALDAVNVHLVDKSKIPVSKTRLVLEGDDFKGEYPFCFLATDGKTIVLGASYSVSFNQLERTLRSAGFLQIMCLDSGHATYASSTYSRRLNNFLCILP